MIDHMIQIMEDDMENNPMDWYMPSTAIPMMNMNPWGYMPPGMPSPMAMSWFDYGSHWWASQHGDLFNMG